MVCAMADPSFWKKAWNWISNLLQIRELWQLLGGGGFATVAAIVLRGNPMLVIPATITAFAAGALIVSAGIGKYKQSCYRRNPTMTWLDLHGGNNLTLDIRHQGLPVKVRARLTYREIQTKLLPQHDQTFDIHLQTRVHGGSYRSIEVSDEFDSARATVATTVLHRSSNLHAFELFLPGLGNTWCDIPISGLIVRMEITFFATSPLGTTQVIKKYEIRTKRDLVIKVTEID